MSNTVTKFTVQFRGLSRHSATTFSTLIDALRWGDVTGENFDVSSESGALVWVWEARI